jgi:hypothetical protein
MTQPRLWIHSVLSICKHLPPAGRLGSMLGAVKRELANFAVLGYTQECSNTNTGRNAWTEPQVLIMGTPQEQLGQTPHALNTTLWLGL